MFQLDDLVCCLFKQLDLTEYQALACCSNQCNKIALTTLPLLQLDKDSTTAVLEDLHLTKYQTCILRGLLDEGKEYKYTCVPDYYNLSVIAYVYAAVTKQQLTVCNLGHPTAEYLPQQIPPSLKKKHPVVINNGLYPEHKVHIGQVALTSNLHLDQIHPLYDEVQRYPVWICTHSDLVSNAWPRAITEERKLNEQWLPDGKIGVDIFVASNRNIYPVYSWLSQLRRRKPAMLVTYTTEYAEKHTGYTPLPLSMLRPYANCLGNSTNGIYSWPEDVTYIELLLMQFYTQHVDSEEEVSTIAESLKLLSDRILVKSSTKPKSLGGIKTVVLEDGTKVSNTHEDVFTPGPVRITIPRSFAKEKWILIDPNQELVDKPKYSNDADAPRSKASQKRAVIKQQLKEVIDNPNLRKGALTKAEVAELCKQYGVKVLAKDTRSVLARKLLDVL